MVETLLIFTHIGAGFTALVVAPVAMRTRKGGSAHKRWGRVYFWAMAVIFVTALLLLLFRPNIFLFLISVLSFYLAFTGVRSLKRKDPAKGQRAIWLDWAAALIALVAGSSFILWGALTLTGRAFGISEASGLFATDIPTSFSVLGIVFGAFLGRETWSDLTNFRYPNPDPMWWWTYHLDRMVSSYLAAVTAFLVQNVGPLLPETLAWLVWVAPGVLGGFGVALWVRYYQRKFAARNESLEPAPSA